MVTKTVPYKELKKMNEAGRENARSKIQAVKVIQRLHEHVFDECMSSGQVKAAEILLKKILPDLSSSDIKTTNVEINLSVTDQAVKLIKSLTQAGNNTLEQDTKLVKDHRELLTIDAERDDDNERE